MAYTKTAWANDTTPAINASNMNKIEQGIADVDSAQTTLKNALGVNSNDFVIKSIPLVSGKYTGSGRPTTINDNQSIVTTAKGNTTKYNFNLTGSTLTQRTGNLNDFTIYDGDFVTSDIVQSETKTFQFAAKNGNPSDKITFILAKKDSDNNITRTVILTMTGKTYGYSTINVSDCASFALYMCAQNGGATSGTVNTIWFTIEINSVDSKTVNTLVNQKEAAAIVRENLIKDNVPDIYTPIPIFGADYTDTYSYINIRKENGNKITVTNSSHTMATAGLFALTANEAHHTANSNGAAALGVNSYILPLKKGRKYRFRIKILSGTAPTNTSAIRFYSYNDGTVTSLGTIGFTELVDGQREYYITGNGDNAGFVLYLKDGVAYNFTFTFMIEDVTDFFNKDYNSIIVTKDKLTQGGYTSDDGVNTNSNRIRISTTFLPYLPKGAIIEANIGTLYYYVFELDARSGATGHYIAGSGWINTPYILKNDCYVLITFATARTSSASANITIDDFSEDYNVRALMAGATINSIYDDYLNFSDSDQTTALLDYAEHLVSASNDIESFMFFTDSHFLGHSGWKSTIEKVFLKMGSVFRTAPVDFCVFGGDALSGSTPEANTMTKKQAMYYLACQDQISRETFSKYYPMVGNHDYNYTSTNNELTDEDLIKVMFRSYGESFYTFHGNNTFCIVLNSGVNRQKFMNQGYKRWEQISWLADNLIREDAPHSMVMLHIQLTNDEYVDSPFFENVGKLCEAYNAHTTITLNNVEHDFTNCTGKVELILGGHLHSDSYYGMTSEENGVPYVMRANTASGSVIPTFDVILCDWENHTVFFKKFGNGSDMIFDLRTGQPIIENDEE